MGVYPKLNHIFILYAKDCQLNIKTNELMALAELSEGWISMIYLNFKKRAVAFKLFRYIYHNRTSFIRTST